MRNAFFVLMIASGLAWAQTDNLSALIEQIDARTKSYTEYKTYTATAVSKSWYMNARWKPEKEVVVTKKIFQQKDSVEETVLKAVEIAGGKETDITEKVRETARKQKEKQREKQSRSGSDRKEKTGKEKDRSFSMSNEELYPFSEKKRNLFDFTQSADTVMNGKTLLRIRASAKTKDPKTYEGLYCIDPKTFDLLLMDVIPSKTPKFVKRMRLKMEFEIFPGNFYVIKRFRMSMEASFLVKKIRMEFEETHSDVRVEG